VQPLLPKRKAPDDGESRRENHLHNKIRLLDYHDRAANVTNQRFIRVAAGGPIATSKQKHPVILDLIQKNNITCCALITGIKVWKTEK